MSRPIRSLLGSFKVAYYGIRYCIANERNMRIHLSIALGVVFLCAFYSFSAAQYALIVLLFCMVIAAEMLNTAIETVVNLLSPGYNHLAKLAKDIAAGAVLVCAVGAAVIGLILFGDPVGIGRLLAVMTAHPVLFFGVAIGYLLLAAAFIFVPARKQNPGREKKDS